MGTHIEAGESLVTVQDFLGRLQRVKKQRDGWIASCPSHGSAGSGDKNPSLSIKSGSDGQILINCFAGCQAWQIVAAMGLTEADLFPEKEKSHPKRTIEHEYSYYDEQRKLVYQCLRYSPKGFSQRRPDGNGGWIYNLQGIRRVVYRLPELLGRQAILWCEGEKDVDRAWQIDIPATCNPMGAGKWDPAYAQQLKDAGVQRVAVIPDNDPVGAAHAAAVVGGLQHVGIEVRLLPLPDLPEHGDLSDYLNAGHTKDDLVSLLRSAPIADKVQAQITDNKTPDKEFKCLGEGRYQFHVRSVGVLMEVDNFKRDRDGTRGELLVKVNGNFPDAKTYRDGILTVGEFNFDSVRARSERAKILADRSGDKGFDWFGALEEFGIEVTTRERNGEPPIVLGADDHLPEPDDALETWDVEGLPILADDAMVIFGDSASGKSYLALWIAGILAQRGIKVLYVDWEFSVREHKKRLRRIFQPTPKNLHYIRSDVPIVKDMRRLRKLIADEGYRYLICDSIGFAVDGPAESHDAARGYFAALRYCGVGSLSLAHIAKAREDGKEATIFGSTFFRAGARSAWFVDRAAENPKGELNVGLHHRKSNSSGLLKPLAYKFLFNKQRVSVQRSDMAEVEALSSQMPLIDRLKRHMKDGEFYTYKDLAEDLDVGVDAIRKTVIRSKAFHRFNKKVRLVSNDSTAEALPLDELTETGKVIHHEF